MNAGGRAEPRRSRAASLVLFVIAALVGTLGHGAQPSPGGQRPDVEDPAAPQPPFVVTREIRVESSLDFSGAAARTTHHLVLERPAFDVATLELTADGPFGTAIDRATASAEGVIDAEAAETGTDCRPASASTVIPENDLKQITADGILSVDVRNSASVTSRCAANRHTVRLRYEALTERLDFAPTRLGSSTTLAITLHRRSGKNPLPLRLSSDRGAFAPLETDVLLEGEGARTVAIRFHPTSRGTVEGTLSIAAEGSAPTRLRLFGEALDPALLGVDPGALDVALPVGGGTTRTVEVGNLSGRALDVVATIEGGAAPGAPAVCASPAVYVLEGISNALARVDLHDGSVTHVGPQILGASSLALEAGNASVLVTTILGEIFRLQTATGARQSLQQGLEAIHDSALSPDGATLYLLQRDAGKIQRFDVASGAVQPFVGGLSFPTRLDLTPDGATLFVATGSGLTQIDVATAAKTVFPELIGAGSPRFDPASGLVYVRTGSPSALRAFDPVSRSLTTVGLLGGSEFTRFALATHGRLAFGLDEFEPLLSRMDLQDGALTPLTSGLESVRDLEVRADADCLGTFLDVVPSTFSLQPNGSATLTAAFSALGARPGTYAAAIRLREAGQAPILASVTAQLAIASAPHLALEGAPRTVEQVQTQRVGTRPGIVTFDLPIAGVTGSGILAITTEASLHGSVGITLEGASVGSDVNPQCVRTTRQHDVGASTLQDAAQDGSAMVRLQLQDLEDFGIACGGDRFTARLTYAGPADSIDFGEVAIGSHVALAPRLRNTGDQVLQVFAIVASGDGFSAPTTPFALAPGAATTLPVTFAATTSGAASGTLRFETNDSETPVVTLPLLAQGTSPAALTTLPVQVTLEAAAEQGSETMLTFDNGGDADVDYSLELEGSNPACPAERLITSDLRTLDLATLERGTLPEPSGVGFRYGMATDTSGSAGFPVVRFGVVGADIATGSSSLLRGMQDARAAALEPGGHTLLVTNSSDNLYRPDLRDHGLDPVGTTALGGHVAVHAPTGLAYLTTKTGLLRSLDLATGASATIVSGLVNPQGIVLSPDGSTAHVIEARQFGHPQGDRLVRVDLVSGAIAPVLEGLRGAEEIVLDPSGGVAYLSEERDARLVAVNLATGQPTTLAESFHASGLGIIRQVSCSGRFLELPPRHGKVAKHGSVQLPLKASAKGLAVGHYNAAIVVHSSDPHEPSRTIPVSFEVLADTDTDGIADRDDNCPALANGAQTDADGDRLGDVCDNCPGASNPGQADRNADGAGDACQPDVALLEIRQDGGGFVVVRLGLADPLGLPLSGEVALLDAATGTAPTGPTAGITGAPIAESVPGAPRIPVTGRPPGGVTAVPAGATPVFTIPFAGRPPRRIDLSPLQPDHPYRLRVSATNGTTIAMAAEAMFLHRSEGTLAFNDPPVARIGALPVLECDRPGGTIVDLSGAGSTDDDSSPGSQDDITLYEWTLDPGEQGGHALGSGPVLQGVSLPLGSHTLLLTVFDALGEAGQVSVPLTVADTRPPALQAIAGTAVLFPPNHEMVPVRVQVTVADACDPALILTFAGATSSEPDDAPGSGDGNTTGDIGAPSSAPGDSADLIVPLRAERAGTGAGRVYEVRLHAADASGNGAPASATVVVPHDLGHGPEPLLMRLAPGPSGTETRILWPGIAAGAAYDVIAGDLGAWRVSGGRLLLGPVRVLARGTNATSFLDPDAPPAPGRARFYLIQTTAAGITTGYSTESAPWPRVPESCEGGCP